MTEAEKYKQKLSLEISGDCRDWEKDCEEPWFNFVVMLHMCSIGGVSPYVFWRTNIPLLTNKGFGSLCDFSWFLREECDFFGEVVKKGFLRE